MGQVNDIRVLLYGLNYGDVSSLSEPGRDPGRGESQITCTSAHHRPGIVLGTFLIFTATLQCFILQMRKWRFPEVKSLTI